MASPTCIETWLSSFPQHMFVCVCYVKKTFLCTCIGLALLRPVSDTYLHTLSLSLSSLTYPNWHETHTVLFCLPPAQGSTIGLCLLVCILKHNLNLVTSSL